jgi:hypothetical protein
LLHDIEAARTELRARQDALLRQLDQNFARWDAGEGECGALTCELKQILSALAYLGTLIRDVEKELET